MSHYISSLLIDPFVRQARRLSRSLEDIPRPDIQSDQPNHEAPSQANPVIIPFIADQEVSTLVEPAAGTAQPTTLNGYQPTSVFTSTSETFQTRSWQLVQRDDEEGDSLAMMESGDAEDEGNAQSDTSATTDNRSYEPLNDLLNNLTSVTSSFSNSARSLVDATMSPIGSSRQHPEGAGQRSRDDSDNSGTGDGFLPADDGMRHTRQRIIAIQRSDSSNEAKARLIHGVMTEKHNPSQQSLTAPRACSPDYIQSSHHTWAPQSLKSLDGSTRVSSPPSSSSSHADQPDLVRLSPPDLTPTYWQPPRVRIDSERNSIDGEEIVKALGCQHYKRNIKLQCSACYKWYTCRFCHDAVEDHMLNRRATKNMLCVLCGCAQPASEACIQCHERAAWYYCDVCKLWDDDPEKSIYHCDDCGICRIGEGLGKDFFHCKVIDIDLPEDAANRLADLLCVHVDIYPGYSSLHRAVD